MNYMPSFEDQDGRVWQLISLHFVVDFGGRQIQIDAQHEGQVKTFVYYYLDDRFTQWDSQEVCDSIPLDGNFQSLLKKLYSTFDNQD